MFVQFPASHTGKMAGTLGHRMDPACSRWTPHLHVLGPHRDFVPIVKVVPIRMEMVHKWTETVHKWRKYGIRLDQAGSVLCLCVRAIFPVSLLANILVVAIVYSKFIIEGPRSEVDYPKIKYGKLPEMPRNVIKEVYTIHKDKCQEIAKT